VTYSNYPRHRNVTIDNELYGMKLPNYFIDSLIWGRNIDYVAGSTFVVFMSY